MIAKKTIPVKRLINSQLKSMQLYALHPNGRLIFAREAEKQQNYFCPECHSLVRLRGGFHRQNHFYHLKSIRHCRQNGKSLEHVNTQLYFLNTLPAGECVLEHAFPSIQRIADVVWLSKKLVFEIQCSPISFEEIEKRNKDYQSLGFTVVWILHDSRFNHRRATAAEVYLHSKLHYFTNISEEGEGFIYDQFSILDKGLRPSKLEPLPINIANPKLHEPLPKDLLILLLNRKSHHTLHFCGDLLDRSHSLDFEDKVYLEKAKELELKFLPQENALNKTKKKLLKHYLYSFIVKPYRLFFQIMLERACK